MGNLVLIGGGRFEDTRPLLQELTSLVEKADPRVVVLPTAAPNRAGEIRAFQIWQTMFEPFSTCVEPLFLMQKAMEKEIIAERLQQADIVYVPGGDTGMMLKIWRKTGVDELLARAYEQGTVLAGRSAGANAWCRSCISADRPKKTSHFIGYRHVWGLGFLDITLCTHYSDRREPFRYYLQEFGGPGIGLDNDQALIIQGDRYRLRSLHEDAVAYRLSTVENPDDDGLPFVISEEKPIEAGNDMRPLEELVVIDQPVEESRE